MVAYGLVVVVTRGSKSRRYKGCDVVLAVGRAAATHEEL